MVKKGVSGKTHTQKQLNDYANQNNPNNKAYKARIVNSKKNANHKNRSNECCVDNLEWYCYGNPFDFE